MIYSLALLNVFWDKNSIDTRYFVSLEAQKQYFDNLMLTQNVVFSELLNFNINDNVSTTVVLKVDKNIEKSLKSNYCIVKNEVGKYRYFFADCVQDSGIQLIINLELDDIQTNYFEYKDTITPCKINRACLDRFDDLFQGNLEFKNKTTTSNLFLEEMPPLPKYTENTIYKNLSVGDTTLYNFFSQGVICWKYVYFTRTPDMGFINVNNLAQGIITVDFKTEVYNDSFVNNDFRVFCYPIFKDSSTKIFFETDDPLKRILIGEKGYKSFRKLNNNASYFFNEKFSLVPPFFDGIEYTQNGNEITIRNKNSGIGYGVQNGLFGLSMDNLFNGVLVLSKQYNSTFKVKDINISFFAKTKFKASELTNNPLKKIYFNPKINSMTCKALSLRQNTGKHFEYDLQKIGKDTIDLDYTEILNPLITKSYLRYSQVLESNKYYGSPYLFNYFGLINSTDESTIYCNDRYSEFLANNKNFNLQAQWSMGSEVAKSAIKGVGEATSGKIGSGVATVLNAGIDLATAQKELSWSIDNMQSSPSTLKEASGDGLFNIAVGGKLIALDLLTANQNDLKNFNDYCVTFGFKCEEIGNIKDYDNIRSKFNYVSASVENITALLSNLEKQRLRERLQAVRFWNSDIINYDYENVENWILKKYGV